MQTSSFIQLLCTFSTPDYGTYTLRREGIMSSEMETELHLLWRPTWRARATATERWSRDAVSMLEDVLESCVLRIHKNSHDPIRLGTNRASSSR